MKTKDYIYLDDEFLNSHLAQLEKGLLVKEQTERGAESTDATNFTHTVTTGLDGFFGLGAKIQSEICEGDNNVKSDFTKNMVENVLNDYAVDLLIEDCSTNGLLCDIKQSDEGDFILSSSKFQIYDFEYLESITDSQRLAPFFSQSVPPIAPGPHATKQERIEYQKQLKYYNDSSKIPEEFEILHNLSVFANALFEDSVLLKLNTGLAICKRNKLRLNKAQASFENESDRKIKVFGVVSAAKKEIHPDGNFPKLKINQLDKIPSIMFDITLSNLNMLYKNDKIIKPIAIYFEAD